MRKTLHTLDSKEESSDAGETPQAEEPVAQVIPTQDAIVNDLLGKLICWATKHLKSST